MKGMYIMNSNVSRAAVPTRAVSNTGGSIILLVLVFILFTLLIATGYYLIASCDPNNKKNFTDYLFDMQFNPCTTDIVTPMQIAGEEAQEYAARVNKREPEVYHISDQVYPYDQAGCKCAAYGGQLATKSQIIDAYNEGADWDNYGWSAGQQAFYPVQPDTYYKCLKNTDPAKWYECRGPGVVGGNFQPGVKFGVNCYGVRPEGHVSIPKPTGPPTEEQVCSVIGTYDSNHQLKTDEVSPFNENKWSVYD